MYKFISNIGAQVRHLVTKLIPFTFIKKCRHKKYIKRLAYALKELNTPDKWIDEYVRESKRDAVLWLLHHYEGEDPFYKVEPKQRIMDVLDMSIRDFTPKDKVYLQVLNYWCTYKRIQGF